jgi:hypothetical protein
MPGLQNEATKMIEQINRKSKPVPTLTFKKIYESTLADSKLRQYAVQVTAAYLSAEDLKHLRELFPHEMLNDLAAFMIDWVEKGTLNYEDFYVPDVED